MEEFFGFFSCSSDSSSGFEGLLDESSSSSSSYNTWTEDPLDVWMEGIGFWFSSLSSLLAEGLLEVSFAGPFSGFLAGSLEEGFLGGSLEEGFLGGSLEEGFLAGSLEEGFLGGSLEEGFLVGPLEEGFSFSFDVLSGLLSSGGSLSGFFSGDFSGLIWNKLT